MALSNPQMNSELPAVAEPQTRETGQRWLKRLLPLFVLIADLALYLALPNNQGFANLGSYKIVLFGFTAIYLLLYILSFPVKSVSSWLTDQAPLLAVFFAVLEVWDLVTLKFNLLPLPYFPSPDKVFGALASDWKLLGISTLYSLRLLLVGYVIGASVGLYTGVSIGWSRRFNYWVGPLLKIIGPIPSTAWIPLVMAVFPTSFSASAFLIALAVWFPVTVMTSSGITNVRNAYFEVARTLGADERYLIFKVAVPAALPLIFIGLFMGLGMSFITLIVAEMLGVKAGLGWYITWAQGWAEYNKVYATLIIIAIVFSSLITLLFKIRDRILVWQKGLIKW